MLELSDLPSVIQVLLFAVALMAQLWLAGRYWRVVLFFLML
jgi:hypothetical protein